MHFSTKNTLKNNRNHTSKQAFSIIVFSFIYMQMLLIIFFIEKVIDCSFYKWSIDLHILFGFPHEFVDAYFHYFFDNLPISMFIAFKFYQLPNQATVTD
jgi:hypothetical protein